MLKEVPQIGTRKKSPQEGQLHTGLPSGLLPGHSCRDWSQLSPEFKDKTHDHRGTSPLESHVADSPISAEVEISLDLTETYGCVE